MRRSSILVFDRHGVMRFGAWRCLSDAYRMAVDGHSPWSADGQDPEPILVPDVAPDPTLAALRSVFDAERIAALAFIPLVHAGRLLGKFMLYYDSSQSFAEHEIRVASSIARFVAGAVDRKRNEVELRRSREHLSLALEAGSMGTWEWDMASGEVVWSPMLERIHGLEPGTFPGTFEALQRDILPEDLPAVLAAARRSAEDGDAYEVTYRIRRPDGVAGWVETRGIVVHDDAGAPVRIVGVSTDVTRRRAGEAERARLLAAERAARLEAETSAARLDTLQRVTAELSRAVALDDVVGVVSYPRDRHRCRHRPPSPTGTQVRFRLLTPHPAPEPSAPTDCAQPAQLARAAPPAPAELHVHQQPDGGRRLELRGELDLAAAADVRGPLLNQLHPPGPVTLDLRQLDYLSSAGVGLLLRACHHAATQNTALQL